MIYLSMICSFLILFCLVMAGAQNSTPLQIEVAWWIFQIPVSGVIFWAALGGAAVVSFLSLPKLAGKALQTRRLRKEVRRLEELCKEPRQRETA